MLDSSHQSPGPWVCGPGYGSGIASESGTLLAVWNTSGAFLPPVVCKHLLRYACLGCWGGIEAVVVLWGQSRHSSLISRADQWNKSLAIAYVNSLFKQEGFRCILQRRSGWTAPPQAGGVSVSAQIILENSDIIPYSRFMGTNVFPIASVEVLPAAPRGYPGSKTGMIRE